MKRSAFRLTSAIALIFAAASGAVAKGDQFYGEIRTFALPFCPQNWVPADGASLLISNYTALFALYGCTYTPSSSSDPTCRTHFSVPDLRARTLIGRDPLGAHGPVYALGQYGGHQSGSLGLHQLPLHTHQLIASTESPSTSEASGSALPTIPPRNPPRYAYSNAEASLNDALYAGSVSVTGGNGALDYYQPFQSIQYCVATDGVWPRRN